MPKQILKVNDFSGGLNSFSHPKDIKDNEFARNWNAVVDWGGIIRVSGQMEKNITTENHNLLYETTAPIFYQPGFGLFQFSSDYSFSQIDVGFSTGFKTGAISDTAAAGATTCKFETDYTGSSNEFNGMSLYIYSGPGEGQTREIIGTSSTTLTLRTALDVELTTSSNYVIFRWTPSADWAGQRVSGSITAREDYITDGVLSDALNQSPNEGGYTIFSRNEVSNNSSETLGNITYAPDLTLKPGVNYTLSFDCAAVQRWTNSVSDGNEDGSAGHGDKVPWAQLYSATVADTSGCIATCDDMTPDGDDLTDVWTASKHWRNVIPFSTSSGCRGYGFTANIKTDGSGNPTFTFSQRRGRNYAIDDEITFKDPGATNEKATLIVASINHTGLSLYAPGGENKGNKTENNFISLTNQVNYITKVDVNYIDNGDFADGETNSWDKVGTSGDLTLDELEGDGYDGVDGTLEMVSNPGFDALSADGPSTWVEQNEILLDEQTPYNLNFLYDSTVGMQYAVYFDSGEDNVDDRYIIPWTSLPPTRDETETNKNYVFAGIYHGVRYPETSDGTQIDYIKFTSPELKFSNANAYDTGNGAGIEIRFSCINDNSTVHIHGVTLHKAHNDLVTIGKNSSQFTNPFDDSIKSFSSYNYTFKIPQSYGEKDDWQFLLHAGHYGYRTGDNTLGASNTQDVYFNNIRLSSEEGDNITILANNERRYSYLSFYSENSSSWVKDFITWEGLKSRPVFNYINGMLQICDSNFENSNGNKLVYYQDSSLTNQYNNSQWITRDDVLAGTPSINVLESFEDGLALNYYNAIPYLNDLYSDKFWGTTNTVAAKQSTDPNNSVEVYSTADSSVGIGGWPLDAFGNLNNTYIDANGLVAPSDPIIQGNKSEIEGTGGSFAGLINGNVIRHMTDRKRDVLQNDGAVISGVAPDDIPLGTVQRVTSVGALVHLFNTNSNFTNADGAHFCKLPDSEISDEGSPNDTQSSGTGWGSKLLRDVCLSNRGWNTRNTDGSVFPWYNDNISGADIDMRGRNPIQFLIKGNDPSRTRTENIYEQPVVIDEETGVVISPALISQSGKANACMSAALNDSHGTINTINIRFKWRSTAVEEGIHPNGSTGSENPWFDIEILKPYDIEADDDIIASIENGNRVYGNQVAFKRVGGPEHYSSEGSPYATIFYYGDGGGASHDDTYNQNGETIFADGSYKTSNTSWKPDPTLPNTWERDIVIEVDIPLTVSVDKSESFVVSISEVSHNWPNTLNNPNYDNEDWHTKAFRFQHNANELYFKDSHVCMQRQTFDSIAPADASQVGSYIKNCNRSAFSTIFVENLTFNFNAASAPSFTSQMSSGRETLLDFVFGELQDEESSVGWGAREFKVAVTSVNLFEEESYIKESSSVIGQNTGTTIGVPIGYAPTVTLHCGNAQLNDPYVSKTKFYMRDSESDIFYLQFYIDHKSKNLYSTTSNKFVTGSYNPQLGITSYVMPRENLKNFNEVNSYESETMVSQEDAQFGGSLTARYKASVVANNRLYVGNIMQDGKIYGDRMLKSPIGKYNLLPSTNFIDVAINDGDEITALAYYKDKILQFKKRKVFVINISGDYEFLEDTFNNVGVEQHCQVTTTHHGVIWANKSGCYVYDGEKLDNLIDNKIALTADSSYVLNNYWYVTNNTQVGTNQIPSIGYTEKDDTLLVMFHTRNVSELGLPGGATYNFPTKSWTFLTRSLLADGGLPKGNWSNFITDKNGDIVGHRAYSGGPGNGLLKWDNNPNIGTGLSKQFIFDTKDFTFGNEAVRKKVYKVYISYITDDGEDSNIKVKTSINSSDSFVDSFSTSSKFAGGDSNSSGTACYTSGTLNETDGKWKIAELKFTTPGDFNNIYSFQLQITSTGNLPASFKINDISIVYRNKNIR